MSCLYLHIPFCRQRCIYCDFYFVTTKSAHDAFLTAMHREIEYRGRRYASEEPVQTIYFGGGTPSLLSVDAVAGLLEKIREAFDAHNVEEITFELNPDDVDLNYLKDLRKTGVDRLSIGIQSFFQEDLEWMNRAHSADEAERIVPMAREAGFENISVDLIFGLPEQSTEAWQKNLKRAVALGVPHLSTYSLTIEPHTPLYKRIERGLEFPASDNTLSDRYRTTIAYLEEQGYEHYEISSFALPGYRSKHNQAYWRHENYIGFGPSAHSFWKEEDGRKKRWSNTKSLKKYEAWPADPDSLLDQEEFLSQDDYTGEYVMLRLRTSDGINLIEMKQTCGAEFDIETVSHLTAQGWIEHIGNTIRLTEQGKPVCNTITQHLLMAIAQRTPS